MAKQITLKTLNNLFGWMGIQERLVKGKGYYYFWEGEAVNWRSTMVSVNRLNALTVEQWMREYEYLSGKTLLNAAPIENHSQLSLRLQLAGIGDAVDFAGMTFTRVTNGVDIDGDIVGLDGLLDHLECLFHYDALDCAGEAP